MTPGHVQVDFHPQYLHRHCGVDFGRQYHSDPFLRRAADFRAKELLHRRFGRDYPSFFPPPAEPDGVEWVGIQPLDFLNAALGGRLEYSSEEAVWTPDKPLEHIFTLDDVNRLPEIDWERQELYRHFLDQSEALMKRHPGKTPGGVQGACHLGDGKALLSTHTPYTTAFRLLGDRIFELMLFEPEVADALFDYLYRQYYNQARHYCDRQGWEIIWLHFGDCAATMLSPDLFASSNLEVARRLTADPTLLYATQHSCGPSTHLLEEFRKLPKLRELQLGYGTDLGKARRLFPDTRIVAYYAASGLLNESPEEIAANLARMAEELVENFVICGSSLDANTPEASLRAFFAAGEAINRQSTAAAV